MKKLAIAPEISILFFFSIFLMTENGWAVASYAQKHGLGCKSCHAFGSELNSLGKSFKKNGYSFGEKNAELKDSVKQDTLKDEKMAASKISAGSPVMTDTFQSGREADPNDALSTAEAEQKPPEARFFKWKSDDGTFHFSDRSYVNTRSEKKTVPLKFNNKDRRNKLKPLSAIVPKNLRNQVKHSDISKTDETASSKTVSSKSFAAENIKIKPKNYENCMEKFFVLYPPPKTSAAAMEQFREAETICAPYLKKP